MTELLQAQAPPHIWHVVALALYTGQRQGDVIRMRWNDIADGLIHVRQGKTGKQLWLPLHRDLTDVLAGIERRAVTDVTTLKGRPWSSNGFQASWADLMRSPAMAPAREQRLVFHGLRKSAVLRLLEAGATDAEVGAITGQSRQMVEHYARQLRLSTLPPPRFSNPQGCVKQPLDAIIAGVVQWQNGSFPSCI